MGADFRRIGFGETIVEELAETSLGAGAIHGGEKRKGLNAAFALKRDKDVAKLTEGAVSADLRGADGAFEDAGDLGERKFLESAEEENFTVVAMKAIQRNMQQLVFIASGRAIAGMWR